MDRCVYMHFTPDTNELFYIGMGTNKRANCLTCRNKHWKKKVEKHGKPKVLIIAENLTDEQAAEYERFWIKLHGLNRLTNISPGGDGIGGFTHTKETIEKIKLKSTGRKHSEKSKQKMSNSRKGVKISQDNIDKIILANTGRKITEETRNKLSENHKSKKKYIFFHIIHGAKVCTPSELRETYNLKESLTSELIHRKVKSHKGWKLIIPLT